MVELEQAWGQVDLALVVLPQEVDLVALDRVVLDQGALEQQVALAQGREEQGLVDLGLEQVTDQVEAMVQDQGDMDQAMEQDLNLLNMVKVEYLVVEQDVVVMEQQLDLKLLNMDRLGELYRVQE